MGKLLIMCLLGRTELLAQWSLKEGVLDPPQRTNKMVDYCFQHHRVIEGGVCRGRLGAEGKPGEYEAFLRSLDK